MSKKVKITLDMLIANEPYEVEVPGMGIVKVRDPTQGDRKEARLEAMESPLWEKYDDFERKQDIGKRVARRMLIEPKISKEEYEKCTDKVDNLLDYISFHYAKKLGELTEEKMKEIRAFLDQTKAEGV